MNTATNTKKIIRVKSKKRFTVFMILSLFLTAFMVNTIICSNPATALADSDIDGKSAKQSDITITVNSGDTLWNIANQYKSEDMDIREAVYIIKDANSLEQSGLAAGSELVIPVEDLR